MDPAFILLLKENNYIYVINLYCIGSMMFILLAIK